SRVILKIYDALSNEVETLIHEELGSGSYNVEFNATNYASGIYFYRLIAGDFVQTKKMILMK
ncbi:MAG: T9SS type A sorting domain-containing protein, partial [Ignavibacteria bacterium]|nr:T9SS type A sorting domain-containing protein [Ignavibacteria bacterium]